MSSPIRILIAEDDSLLRRTMVELLSFDKEFEVVAHVPNGAMALQELEHGVSVNRPACGRVRDTFGFAVSFEGADARRSAGVERR